MSDETNSYERDEAGRFLPGNRIWEARSSYGPKPKFADPESLRAACIEYFEWVTDTPLEEEKLFSYEGSVTRTTTNKMHAMTLRGMCLYIDITFQTWTEYRKREDLADVCEWVDTVIFTQKFTGAAAGLLNPGIVARELGLGDKTMLGNDPDNPLPAAPVQIFQLPDNGRD